MSSNQPGQSESATNVNTPASPEEYVVHQAPLQQITPVELLPSLRGAPESLRKAITDERRKRSREAAENLLINKTQRESLERARIDQKTGLRNSDAFEREFPSIFSRANPGELAIIYLDLNGLKRANDMSHEVGDKYLKTTAGAIRKSLRPTDLVYRVGGDEVIVVMPNTLTEEEVKNVEERIRTNSVGAIAGLRLPDELYLGVSVGFAIKRPSESADDLKNRADMVLRDDKEAFYADIEQRTGLNLRR